MNASLGDLGLGTQSRLETKLNRSHTRGNEDSLTHSLGKSMSATNAPEKRYYFDQHSGNSGDTKQPLLVGAQVRQRDGAEQSGRKVGGKLEQERNFEREFTVIHDTISSLTEMIKESQMNVRHSIHEVQSEIDGVKILSINTKVSAETQIEEYKKERDILWNKQNQTVQRLEKVEDIVFNLEKEVERTQVRIGHLETTMSDISRDIFRVQPDIRNFVTMDTHERAIKMMEDKYRYLEARLAMTDRNVPGNNRTYGGECVSESLRFMEADGQRSLRGQGPFTASSPLDYGKDSGKPGLTSGIGFQTNRSLDTGRDAVDRRNGDNYHEDLRYDGTGPYRVGR